MVCRTADDKKRWAIPFQEAEWLAGGGLLRLPGGDVLAFLYGGISDSGVQVLRLDPVAGKAVWQARCAPLGVFHSKYRHRATATIEGDQVEVTSRGSFGMFVETLDLKTGRQIRRQRMPAEP